ncbi:hypothetical protein [Streptomyces tritici]|uniref:hypothetical protein n=1 Tax=Streptomyces tritici TaxID=2054410 RepID=UPI003AF0B0ED
MPEPDASEAYASEPRASGHGDLAALDFTAGTRHLGRPTGRVCANRPAEFRRLRQERERVRP